jgi:dihydrofolate synthase/folylpolyglutamate synthase
MLHAGGIIHPSLRDGINEAVAPGRFEIRSFRGHPVILDGAHNGPAAEALVQTLARFYPGTEFTLVTNMLSGHHASDFYQPIKTVARRAIVAPIFNTRARTPVEAQAELAPFFDQVDTVATIAEAFLHAQGPILVTGSNYLVGDAIRFLNDQ